MASKTVLAPDRINTAFFTLLRPTSTPDQSPENFAFKNIVGRAEAKRAMAQTAKVRSGQRKINLNEGKMATAHGSTSGKLLVLALVSMAAARMDVKKSHAACEVFARTAKSTDASAKVAPNKSLPMLPACSK